MKNKILEWFANGRVGSSSKAMACAVANMDCSYWAHPSDPDDLNRCLLFLQQVPEAREHLDKLKDKSKYWAALIPRFNEVEKCFLDEVGLNWCKGGRAEKTFKLMKSIFNPIEEKDSSVMRFGDMSIHL